MDESTPTNQPTPLVPTPVVIEPASLPLPKVWPGFAMAGLLLAVELIYAFLIGPIRAGRGQPTASLQALYALLPPLTVLAALAYFGAVIYWLWSVYRIHRVLAQVTHSSYPISAGKAVGFQLIPIYVVYWNFKWTNQLANFVNSRSSSSRMARNWTGVFLFLTSCLFALDKGIQLLAFFAISLYLLRKLIPALSMPVAGEEALAPVALAVASDPVSLRRPAADPWDFTLASEWKKLPLKVACAATFGFLAYFGLVFFVQEYVGRNTVEVRNDVLIEVTAIAVVALLLFVFVEPLFNLLQQLGLGEPRIEEDEGPLSKRLLRFGLFIAVIVLSHTLLEKVFSNVEVKGKAIWVALELIILFFVMSYALVIGCGQPRMARAFQLMLAAAAGSLTVTIVFMSFLNPEGVKGLQYLFWPGTVTEASFPTASQPDSNLNAAEASSMGGSAVTLLKTLWKNQKEGLTLLAGHVPKDLSQRAYIEAFAFSLIFFFVLVVLIRRRHPTQIVAFLGFVSSFVLAILATLMGSKLGYTYSFPALWAVSGSCIAILAFGDLERLRLPDLGILAVPAVVEHRHKSLLEEDPTVRKFTLLGFLLLVGFTAFSLWWGSWDIDKPPDEHHLQTAQELQDLFGLKIGPACTKAGSTVDLTTPDTPLAPNTPVALTATVTPQTNATPTGTVTFKDQAQPVGVATLSNGTASLPTTFAKGQHSITAEYSGDSSYASSASGAMQLAVAPVLPNSVTLAASSAEVPPNVPVTFTAKVLSNRGDIPVGSVTFKDNSALMATEDLVNGVGTFTTRNLQLGSHTITAEYSGGGSSNPLTEKIELAIVQPSIQVIPAGTPIIVRTIDPVDSATAKVGQMVHASLQAPPALYHAPATLRVVRVDPAGKLTGHSSVTLELESVTIGSRNYPVRTIPVERLGPSKTADTIKKTGIGAAIGGTVGGIFGHKKGAAVGAASGAGAGAAAAALTSAGPAKVPSKTVLTFHLKSSLNLAGSQ